MSASLLYSIFVLLTFLFVTVLPSPPPTLPPPILFFLTRVHRSLSASLLGFALYYFYLCLLCLFFFHKQNQVGIMLMHFCKQWPTKKQIYCPSAVCNCTYCKICPLFSFCVQFVEGAHLEISLAWGDFLNSTAEVIPLKQRFHQANTGIHLSQGLTTVCFPVPLFCQTKPANSFSQSHSFRGIHYLH